MNGYSKLKVIKNTKPRSMESSDLAPKSISEITQKCNLQNPENNHQIKTCRDSSSEQEAVEQEGNHGETLIPNLRRNSSVSSSAYALEGAVRRAFSMGRSSSVSERYCRIHDQSVTLASPFDDEEMVGTTGTGRSETKKGSRGKILKAWKKLFGL